MQITQCPECTTAFKVTPEQLGLAQGWVRCGRCGAVFEALKHVPPTEALSSPVPQSPPASAPSAVKPAKQTSMQSSMDPSMGPSWVAPEWADDRPPKEAVPIEASIEKKPASTALGLSVLSVLLVMVLLWQAVLYQRNWLMAQEPALQGVLSALCLPVGCKPNWPQLPESLQVEGSGFTHDPEGFYNLQVRVKNTEHFSLAAPHMELTLVDSYDDVVLRRVFSPQELHLSSPMPPLRDVRAGLEFMLDAALAERVTGYRVLLFYP